MLRDEAKRLGFTFVGVSKAGFLASEANRLEEWLRKGMHGQMAYMENHFDMRLDPTKLVPGAKSVVSLMYNYYSEAKQVDPTAPKLSMYAYGKDYHFVVKDKLKSLLQYLQQEIGDINGRVFVDSAPVMERAWAAKSGLGWIGKNSLLLSKKAGSYFFLAELIIDLELEYDPPTTDHCGTCTACMDACPTDAITPYVVDGSKCISYFTIELKEAIPTEMAGKFNNWAFGCDICQQVCPWNRFAQPNNEPLFAPQQEMLDMSQQDWEEITEEVFKKLFKDTPLQRTKYQGLKRNIDFLKLKKPMP